MTLMSLEEVSSLTVPKLKAELTRLGQPLQGLKRKAQLVEALTVSYRRIKIASHEAGILPVCVRPLLALCVLADQADGCPQLAGWLSV